jgi:hypothetical protein
MSRRSLKLSTALVALVLTSAGAARAEVDITGVWQIAPEDGGQQAHQAPAPMTPRARAEQQAVNKINQQHNRLIGEAHTKCWPTGMPGLMSTPFGIEFLQTKGRVTILNEVSNLPRTIYLDENAHPDSFIPGWNGHSIGHWEKDVLVVDTIGFNGRMNNASEKMHITEKLYLDKAGYLHDDMMLDDPETYTAPYQTHYRYKKAVGLEANEVMEYVCEVDPTNLVAFEQEQKAAGRESAYDPAWAAEAFSKPASAAAIAGGGPKNPLTAAK